VFAFFLSFWLLAGGFEGIGAVDLPDGVVARNVSARPRSGGMLQVGEVLRYKVGYLFFHLGTIRIQVDGREERNGRVVYKASAYLDSRIPVITDLHIRFESELDEEIFSYWWTAEDSTDGEIQVRKMTFDYEKNRVTLEKGRKKTGEPYLPEGTDSGIVTTKCQDGLSLFFYAREHVKESREHNVATVIDTEQVNTYINFRNAPKAIEIDAVDYDVDVVDFDGEAEFVGVFGLTGGFQGWFSNDDARVPIYAKMNVIIGSITVELESWERPGWEPPRYVEREK
jgi:hypothetical protein